MKILCLGNEFVKEDSLAKKVAFSLRGYEIKNIKDSFQLVDEFNKDTEFVILDVVEGIKKVKVLKIEDLKQSSILTAHDFDAGFLIKLLKIKVKIIGIPQIYDEKKAVEEVRGILSQSQPHKS